MTTSKLLMNLETSVKPCDFALLHYPALNFSRMKEPILPSTTSPTVYLRYSKFETFLAKVYKEKSSFFLKVLRFSIAISLTLSIVGTPFVFYIKGRVRKLKERRAAHVTDAELLRKEKNREMQCINLRANLVEIIGLNHFKNLRITSLEGRNENLYANRTQGRYLPNLSTSISYRGLNEIGQAFIRLAFKKDNGSIKTLDFFEFSYPNPFEWKAVLGKKREREPLKVKAIFDATAHLKELLNNSRYELLTP